MSSLLRQRNLNRKGLLHHQQQEREEEKGKMIMGIPVKKIMERTKNAWDDVASGGGSVGVSYVQIEGDGGGGGGGRGFVGITQGSCRNGGNSCCDGRNYCKNNDVGNLSRDENIDYSRVSLSLNSGNEKDCSNERSEQECRSYCALNADRDGGGDKENCTRIRSSKSRNVVDTRSHCCNDDGRRNCRKNISSPTTTTTNQNPPITKTRSSSLSSISSPAFSKSSSSSSSSIFSSLVSSASPSSWASQTSSTVSVLVKVLFWVLVFNYHLSVMEACPLVCTCKWKGGKQTVECKNQALETLPDSIDPETQVLDISGNKLGFLPQDAFRRAGLLNLQRIHVRNSRLTQIDPGAFNELKNLVEIDLGDNLLTSVPSLALKATPFLRDLNLAGNPIQRIPKGGFEFVPQLVKLDLSRCQLVEIDPQAFAHLKLESLKISSNRLTSLNNHTAEERG